MDGLLALVSVGSSSARGRCFSIAIDDRPTRLTRPHHQRPPQIDAYLPSIYQGYAWGLLYSLQQHGASNSTFLRRVKGKTPTVLVVRTTENEVCMQCLIY